MNKKTHLYLLVPISLLLGSTAISAQTERVLVVGDSWAEFTWLANSVDEALTWAGHADKIAVGDTTAISGTTAAQWNTSPYQTLIAQALIAYPTIDVIHLHVGGNDFLGQWNTSLSPMAVAALYQEIADDIEGLVSYIHSLDPTLEIVYPSYDYLNFEEVPMIGSYDWFVWLLLGFPTSDVLNAEFFALTRNVYQRFHGNPKVHFINNSGLMQYVFGYPSLGIAPRTLPLPGNESTGWRPLLGGDPNLMSPPEAMSDGFHLNGLGFDSMAKFATYHFYDAYFNANP